LTPSTGMPALRASSAARRKVPSPPENQHKFAALGGAGSASTTSISDAHDPHIGREQAQ